MKKLNSKTVLLSLCILVFIDSISAGLIFPIMPELFLNPKYGLMLSTKFFSAEFLYGLSFALFPLASFIGMPLMGALSDTFGRKKIMVYGVAGICICDLIACVGIINHNVYLFLLSRLLTGFCAGTYVVASAIIADLSSDISSKMNNFKWPMLAFISGFVLGPILGSSVVISNNVYSLSIPFIIALTLAFFNLIMIIVFLPQNKICKKPPLLSLKDVFVVFSDKHFKSINISYILYQLAISTFLQSISMYLALKFKFTISNIGIFFTIMCIGLALSTLVLQPLMMKFLIIKNIVFISIFIIAIMLFIQGLSTLFSLKNSVESIWSTTFIIYIFLPLAGNGFTSCYSNLSDGSKQGIVMGAMGQINAIASALSGLYIGYLVANYQGLMMLTASMMCLASFIYYGKFVSTNFNKMI